MSGSSRPASDHQHFMLSACMPSCRNHSCVQHMQHKVCVQHGQALVSANYTRKRCREGSDVGWGTCMCVSDGISTLGLAHTWANPSPAGLNATVRWRSKQLVHPKHGIALPCPHNLPFLRCVKPLHLLRIPITAHTWNSRFLAASRRNAYVVSLMPMVRMTSLACRCSTPCAAPQSPCNLLGWW